MAVLTGAASGCGPAVARALAADGWALALGEPCPDDAARTRLEQVAEACRGLGVAVGTYACDVRRPAEVGRLVAEAAALGPVEAAVALTGSAASAPGPAWQLPPAVVESDLDAHYRSLVVLARAAVPHLLDVGSRGRFLAVLGASDADAAAAAGLAFLRRLAADLVPSGVTVNALLPGDGTDTQVATQVAPVAAWACSAGSSGVTGAVLPLGPRRGPER